MKIFIMKKLFLLVSFLIFNLVFAEEVNKFFEVSPLSYTKFKLGTKILKQPVYFFNDYLSAISFRLENETSSEINLKIVSEDGETIFEKDFIVPKIEYAHWGKEYFFPLGENIRVSSNKKYFLIITPKFFNTIYFYYLDKEQLLQGSEEKAYIFDRVEELLVNDEPSGKILRLAFYEGKENLPPQILNFKIEIFENKKAKVSFNANEPIKYQFSYENKISKNVSSFNIDYFETCPPLKKLCFFEIDVESGVKYSYKFEAQDFWNNLSSLSGEFEVPKIEILESKNLENKSETEKTYATSLKMTITSTLEKPSVFIQEKKESKVEVNQKLESVNLEKKLEKTSQEITKSKETLLEEKNKKQEIKNESLEKAKEETLNEKSQKEQNKLKVSKNLTKILPIFLLLLILLFIIYKRSR